MALTCILVSARPMKMALFAFQDKVEALETVQLVDVSPEILVYAS